MAENKTKKNDLSVDEFLETVEPESKRDDCFKVVEIMCEITGEEPKMWGTSIVGFGDYHYVYDSGREGDFMKVGFSPRKSNITLYIMSGFDAYEDLMSELGKFKTGKSCLYIKKLEDVDEETLRSLIEASIQYIDEKYPAQ